MAAVPDLRSAGAVTRHLVVHHDPPSGAELTRLAISARLAFALAVAFVVTVPVNRWLIGRGRGHAVVHRFHGSGNGAQH